METDILGITRIALSQRPEIKDVQLSNHTETLTRWTVIILMEMILNAYPERSENVRMQMTDISIKNSKTSDIAIK